MKKHVILLLPVFLMSLSSCNLFGPDNPRDSLKKLRNFDMIKFMEANEKAYTKVKNFKKLEVHDLDVSNIQKIQDSYVFYKEEINGESLISAKNLMNDVYSFKNVPEHDVGTVKLDDKLFTCFDERGISPLINFRGEVVLDKFYYNPAFDRIICSSFKHNGQTYIEEAFYLSSKEHELVSKTNVFKAGDSNYKRVVNNFSADLTNPLSVEDYAEYNDLTEYGLPGYHFMKKLYSVALYDQNNNFVYNSKKLKKYFDKSDYIDPVRCEKYFFRFEPYKKAFKFNLLTGEETEYELDFEPRMLNLVLKNYKSNKTDLIACKPNDAYINIYDTNFNLVYENINPKLFNKYYKIAKNFYMNVDTLFTYDVEGHEVNSIGWQSKDKAELRYVDAKNKKMLVGNTLYNFDCKKEESDLYEFQIDGKFYKNNFSKSTSEDNKIEQLDGTTFMEFDGYKYIPEEFKVYDPFNERILHIATLKNIETLKIEKAKYYFLDIIK